MRNRGKRRRLLLPASLLIALAAGWSAAQRRYRSLGSREARLLQTDGQIAWASPIWVTPPR